MLEDLEGLIQNCDVVQLPLSLYDQRLIQNSTISRLHRAGVSLHVRSIYLQGLLLAPEESWPNWVSPKVRQHHRRLIDLCRTKDCRLIDLALGFLKAQSDIDAVVVGISSLADLKELNLSWQKTSPWSNFEWEGWSLQDTDMLDPRYWPI